MGPLKKQLFPLMPSCQHLCIVFFLSPLSTKSSFDISSLLLMFQESSDPVYISNPCYPEGFNITIKASSIYDTKCTRTPRNYDPNREFLIVGAGSSDGCEKVVKSLFDFKNCSSSNCSFNGVEMPPVNGDFLVKHDANKRQIYWKRSGWEKKNNNSTVPVRHTLDFSMLQGR